MDLLLPGSIRFISYLERSHMRRFLGVVLSIAMISVMFVFAMPVGAQVEHQLEKYINSVIAQDILPDVDNWDMEITADVFAEGLGKVLGKEVAYDGENFTRAEMFKFAIDNHDTLSAEVANFDGPAWCWSNDELTIPKDYVPYFNLAVRPKVNILTYRFRNTAWNEIPSYAEAAYLLYKFKLPPNTDPGQVITCVTQQEPDTMNPYTSSAVSQTFLAGFVGSATVDYGEDAILFPKTMALDRPSIENGGVKVFKDEITGQTKMVVTWHLRPAIYWPPVPGEPEDSKYHEFTADDVLFGVKVGFSPQIQSIASAGVWKIDSYKKIDKYTVEVQYNEEYTYATWGIGGIYKAMFERDFYTYPSNFNVREDFYDYMFGPYRIKEWNKGNYFDFEPNPYAAFAQPLIDKIRVKFMTDVNTIQLNLQAEEIDMVFNAFSPLQANELKDEMTNYKFHYVESTAWEHIDLNQFDEDPAGEMPGYKYMFGDKRVRQAMLYALDREELCMIVSQGVYTPSHLWMTPRSKYYKKADEMGMLKRYEYNPEKAEQLLDEAGWVKNADGWREKDSKLLEVNLTTASGQNFRQLSVENIIKMWERIGIKAKGEFLSATVVFGGDYLRRHQFQAVEFAWSSNPIRPNANLWREDQIPGDSNAWSGQNMGGWVGPEGHEELCDDILRELPDDELQDVLNKQFEIWCDEIPALPLYNRYNIDVTVFNLENYKPTA